MICKVSDIVYISLLEMFVLDLSHLTLDEFICIISPFVSPGAFLVMQVRHILESKDKLDTVRTTRQYFFIPVMQAGA